MKDCKASSCKKCGKRHNTLLHRNTNTNSHHNDTTEKPLIQEMNSVVNVSSQNKAEIQTSEKHILLSTAIIKIANYQGKLFECRALLDCASQSTIITKSLCDKLKLNTKYIQIPITGINQTLTSATECTSVKIVSNANSEFTANVNCLVLPQITALIPHTKLDARKVKFPRGIKLADPQYDKPATIDILLGADIFWQVMKQDTYTVNNTDVTLRDTHLGWICTGSLPSQPSDQMGNKSICQLNITDPFKVQLEKFWKIEDIDLNLKHTVEENECEKSFIKSVSRDVTGRYTVELPIKENVQLGSSSNIAMKRFFSLEHKLERQPELYKQYVSFMEQYESLGHMTRLPLGMRSNSTQQIYYIPHFAVERKQSSSTPVRVVFDASAKTSNGKSLNDFLRVGPTIQESLSEILLRFRTYNFVITGDIEKMYRQINITENQRDLQRIYWRKNRSEPVQIYRLKTVTYGTASAPFLATRTLKQLYEDEGQFFPLANAISQLDYYVDDLLTGNDDLETTIELRKQVTELLSKGGFHITKWATNNKQIFNSIPKVDRIQKELLQFDDTSEIKVLGFLWQPKTDTFSYTLKQPYNVITKRHILSEIARLYDPLGLIGPLVTIAKILMQQLWLDKVGWDQELSEDIQQKWKKFTSALSGIKKVQIPRSIKLSEELVNTQIHMFADASLSAYGSCIYIRGEYSSGKISSRLFIAKSRISPIKQLTLPRLELNAALLGTNLLNITKAKLNLKINEIHCWTDSSIVLAWIKKDISHLSIYVANRVQKITHQTATNNWKHVRSEDNPADIISRGASAENLRNSVLWWEGPDWLSQNKKFWPQSNVDFTQCAVPETHDTVIQTCVNIKAEPVLCKYSSMNKLVRIIAYCKRFINNCKSKISERKTGSLEIAELDAAWITIIARVQNESFASELRDLKQNKQIQTSSKLKNLDPFIDQNGLLRVGGRLQHSNLSLDQKHPVILPSKHHVTKLIIMHHHLKHLHMGIQGLLYQLRQTVWIIHGRQTVRSVLRKCVTCFKVKPTMAKQIMGQLPKDRVNPYRPFLVTGVDYCGPIYIKTGLRKSMILTKSYIALFICLATKAIHLELVSDLTTASFIAAFRRFISRRGVCKRLYSDNATNFIGANRELKELKQTFLEEKSINEIQSVASELGTDWKWIPPRSPHHEGLWESVIRQMKHHLRRTLQNNAYTYEYLNTLIIQIEACLNSRPITQMSDDPNDFTALSPGHFLIGQPLTALPEPSYQQIPDNRLTLWKQLQKMFQSFWKRWNLEYLNSLQQRTKWHEKSHENLLGRLVTVKDQNSPPMSWRLGRIIEIYPGPDNLIRVISIKTNDGIIRRSIQQVALLPIET